jgi:hypothetical protein
VISADRVRVNFEDLNNNKDGNLRYSFCAIFQISKCNALRDSVWTSTEPLWVHQHFFFCAKNETVQYAVLF